ncbi:M14 family metallopeptidase [candidate division KSB1 bacterium]
MKRLITLFVIVLLVINVSIAVHAQTGKIYWGDAVPEGWNGKWDEKFLTVPEKTDFNRTTSSYQIHEYINILKWNSENVHVFNMYTSELRTVCSAVVLAEPRVTSPDEARRSGKPVIYIQGNIHPPEAEGKEAILMLMRDILLGDKKYLLDNQILIFCPNFNVDGNDTWSTRDGTPNIIGTRTNAGNYDLNRDAIKLETIEVNGLYRTVINRWDPVMFFDAHAMGRVKHGYAICYAGSTVPAAHPEPRGYVYSTLFPEVRNSVRDNFGLEIFTHCLHDEDNWPPTVWSHDFAYWSTEAKFVANAYGLRNRMSILVETAGYPSFERKIYSQYAYITELLEYTNRHGKEMMEICRKADEEIVNNILENAGSGKLKNFVEGEYESWGKVDIYAYRENEADFIPGTSVRRTKPGTADGKPELVSGVEHLTRAVGTKEAVVPRGYLIPAELDFIAEKLRTMGIKVDMLENAVTASGEEFVIDGIRKRYRDGYNMTILDGNFVKSENREFPAGTYIVDMAQPLANLAFYSLEPEVRDNFVGWNILDDYLESIDAGKRSVVYPVFKYLKIEGRR